MVLPRTAAAQSYPDRPIRLIVPFPPGGAYDSLARPWAERIKPLLGSIVVENIGGAGASLGASAVAKARPDGYTLLLGGTLPHVNEALLKAKPLYDPNKDLDPIMQIAVGHIGFAVHPSVPAKSLGEFVAYVKANPTKVSYGHVGIGSTNHLVGELFKSIAGIPELVQIPYRGAGPVITDLIGGQIPMGVVACTPQSLGLHKSGGLRILAVTGSKPLLAAPDLPTVAQAGFPGVANEVHLWPARSRRDAEADHRQDRQHDPRAPVDARIPAVHDRDGLRGDSRVRSRKFPQGARRCGQVLGAAGERSSGSRSTEAAALSSPLPLAGEGAERA